MRVDNMIPPCPESKGKANAQWLPGGNWVSPSPSSWFSRSHRAHQGASLSLSVGSVSCSSLPARAEISWLANWGRRLAVNAG